MPTVMPPGWHAPQAGLVQFPAALPAPKIRGKGPDETSPRTIPRLVAIPTPEQLGLVRPAGDIELSPSMTSIPTPEQLGLLPANKESHRDSTQVEWAATRDQLRNLGASKYQLDRLAQGFRFTCWLAVAPGGTPSRIDAEGGTELEAVRSCLEKATLLKHFTR
ncbi:MAG: hypothetical protein ACRD36_05685 [Candidatus Acidiferrum sp.]